MAKPLGARWDKGDKGTMTAADIDNKTYETQGFSQMSKRGKTTHRSHSYRCGQLRHEAMCMVISCVVTMSSESSVARKQRRVGGVK